MDGYCKSFEFVFLEEEILLKSYQRNKKCKKLHGNIAGIEIIRIFVN